MDSGVPGVSGVNAATLAQTLIGVEPAILPTFFLGSVRIHARLKEGGPALEAISSCNTASIRDAIIVIHLAHFMIEARGEIHFWCI
ncbi:hypothetical protein OESDEN_01135 [Oesophagostomum dentatum]|uniref:Uncharacterized protein n=1 Tax=Oesophagostomum dentatum TaxID=61180 RepID=A0A0B1TSQ6_OESDE|nr:hypothetical protein OESDEN_01135 [Oesophagostomum dentatum]